MKTTSLMIEADKLHTEVLTKLDVMIKAGARLDAKLEMIRAAACVAKEAKLPCYLKLVGLCGVTRAKHELANQLTK